jgi:hypothetical protein
VAVQLLEFVELQVSSISEPESMLVLLEVRLTVGDGLGFPPEEVLPPDVLAKTFFVKTPLSVTTEISTLPERFSRQELRLSS